MKNLECVSVAGVNGTPSQFIFCSAKYTVGNSPAGFGAGSWFWHGFRRGKGDVGKPVVDGKAYIGGCEIAI